MPDLVDTKLNRFMNHLPALLRLGATTPAYPCLVARFALILRGVKPEEGAKQAPGHNPGSCSVRRSFPGPSPTEPDRINSHCKTNFPFWSPASLAPFITQSLKKEVKWAPGRESGLCRLSGCYKLNPCGPLSVTRRPFSYGAGSAGAARGTWGRKDSNLRQPAHAVPDFQPPKPPCPNGPGRRLKADVIVRGIPAGNLSLPAGLP